MLELRFHQKVRALQVTLELLVRAEAPELVFVEAHEASDEKVHIGALPGRLLLLLLLLLLLAWPLLLLSLLLLLLLLLLPLLARLLLLPLARPALLVCLLCFATFRSRLPCATRKSWKLNWRPTTAADSSGGGGGRSISRGRSRGRGWS